MLENIEIRTDDLYEASYYVLNGGVVKEIEFGKLQENKWHKKGFKTTYILTVSNVYPQFKKDWKEFRAYGAVRQFSNIRNGLKRKILKLQKKRDY